MRKSLGTSQHSPPLEFHGSGHGAFYISQLQAPKIPLEYQGVHMKSHPTLDRGGGAQY